MNEKSLLEFAKTELKLINFDQSDLYEPILSFLKYNAKECQNNTDTMHQVVNLLTKLIDNNLLSPITEDDFELEYQDDTITIYKCTRHPYIYKDSNGKYWNDRAIAFQFDDNTNGDKVYLYQSGNNSKQEVELPYTPKETIKIIRRS
jgi:hypothetical protein